MAEKEKDPKSIQYARHLVRWALEETREMVLNQTWWGISSAVFIFLIGVALSWNKEGYKAVVDFVSTALSGVAAVVIYGAVVFLCRLLYFTPRRVCMAKQAQVDSLRADLATEKARLLSANKANRPKLVISSPCVRENRLFGLQHVFPITNKGVFAAKDIEYHYAVQTEALAIPPAFSNEKISGSIEAGEPRELAFNHKEVPRGKAYIFLILIYSGDGIPDRYEEPHYFKWGGIIQGVGFVNHMEYVTLEEEQKIREYLLQHSKTMPLLPTPGKGAPPPSLTS